MRKFAKACGVSIFISCFALSVGGIAHSQDYPTREIHSIVNFPPASGMDIMIRYYSVKLAELSGKPVIVENKPGASGNIGTEYLARAKPDGYTIGITPASSTLAAAASLFKKLPFDPIKDFQPVVLLTKLAFIFAVDAKSPVQNMADLTKLLKAKPGHGSFGTVSNTGVIAGELYKVKAGLNTAQVSYRGNDMFNDLYGGQLDFIVLDPTSLKEPIATGKMRALAVTSNVRLGTFPAVPTAEEAGLPGFDLTPWIGLVVPAGTPQPIVDKLAMWHRKINEMDQTKKILLQFGMDPLEGDAAAFAARLKADMANWAEWVKLAKIEPQ
jgi:tripartite-type tricarboxylate transporter receptor subunit TctC